MLKGSALVFLSRNFQKVVAAIVLVILGRTLDKAGVGAWGLMVAVLTYATTIGSLGIGPAHVHFRGQGRMEIRHVLANALAGAVIFGLLAIIIVKILRELFGFELGDPLVLTVVSIAFPVALLQNYMDFLWQGEDRLGIYSGLFVLRAATLPAFLLLGLQLPDPYVGLALALVANATVTLATSLFLVHREYGLRAEFDRSLFTQAARYGLHIQAGSVAQAIGYRFDYFLINGFLGRTQTGLYVTATNMAEALWMLPFALSIALLPRVSTKNVESAREVTARTCRLVFAISVLGGAVLFLLAGLILRLLFENRFAGSVTPLRILLAGTVVFAVQKILANYFIGQGKAKWFLRATLLSMAVNLGLNLWLLRSTDLGINGAAIASAVSYSLSTAILAVLFVREAGLRLRDLFVLNRDDIAQLGVRLGGLRRRAAARRPGRLAR